ncbi:conserved protein, unknown function [Hepatocystis sp. ex Piliocolobus tephrosceles]|nr:conserved protein, unknown function [Hepatocystis sp. ex Piliocolobus tephrosceles]
MNWKKVLGVAGGAAAVVAITYMLMKDDDNPDEENNEKDGKKKKDSKLSKDSNRIIRADTMTREDLLQLLKEMLTLQTDMKNVVKDLTEVAKKNNYDFMAVYNIAKTYNTTDPLGKYQIEMQEFDNVVESYNFDPEVKEAVSKLMSAPENYYANMSDAKILSVEKIIEIHHFMLNELYKIDPEFKKIPNRNELDPKLIALVVQSIVSAKVAEGFNLTSEDVEASIAHQHYALASDMEFSKINIQMQTIMNKFMDEHFKLMCDREGVN